MISNPTLDNDLKTARAKLRAWGLSATDEQVVTALTRLGLASITRLKPRDDGGHMPLPDVGTPATHAALRVLALIEQGLKPAEAARRTGLSRTRVGQIRKQWAACLGDAREIAESEAS